MGRAATNIAKGSLAVAAWLLSLLMLAAVAIPAAQAAEPAVAGGPAGGGIGSTVYVVHADRPVESGLQKFLERAYKEAENGRADRIVLVVDTLGGAVASAEAIGDLVRSSKVPTTALVQGRAVSAGTYIALNADELAMEPGSVIGAAAVVDGSGGLVSNPKVVAYWTAKMKEAAQQAGRNPDIAAAMVNPDMTLELPELGRTDGKGEVLALTASEAVKVGYADYTASSVQEVIDHLGLQQPTVIDVKPTAAEKIARFLTGPFMMTLLLVVGIAGVAIELFVPGFGVPGITGIVAFGLYFFGHYLAGFAGWEEVLLFVVGILLLAAELFVPSFGILGLLGSASLIAGVVLAAPDPKTAGLSFGAALVVSGIIVLLVVKRFSHRGVWNRFILRDSLTKEQGYSSSSDKAGLLGMRGHALTPLRPSGTAKIGGMRVDVVTSGEFIAPDTEVEVIRVEGARVVVRQVNVNLTKIDGGV